MTFTPRVLSIAGTDPTGGAGVQADLASISAAGGYAMAAVTALVAQNTHGVRSIHTPEVTFLREQLDAVADDVTIDAIKIGMLGSVAIAEEVSAWLAEHPIHPVVLDPVMVATSGDHLMDPEAESAVKSVALKHADVITPNIKELAVLADAKPATTLDEAIAQARSLASELDVVVLVKGGHLSGEADNAVVHGDGRIHLIPSHRVDTPHTHGTGCSLSSALATRLALGEDVDAAADWATRWIHEAIAHGAELHVASEGGHGPVHHYHRLRRMAAASSTAPWAHRGNPDYAPASSDLGDPLIAYAGPHTRRLWELAQGYLRETLDLDFIKELTDGTLPREEFRFYLSQDAAYLNQYARALALVAAKAPTAAAQAMWAGGARECIEGELELHRGIVGECDRIPPSTVTSAYTDFLIARAATESYVCGVAAVLPCYWLYAEIGLRICADGVSEDHPYHAWLTMYSGEEFAAAAREAIEFAEAAFEAATDEERARATEVYLDGCVHEREFFDQASRRWA